MSKGQVYQKSPKLRNMIKREAEANCIIGKPSSCIFESVQELFSKKGKNYKSGGR